jgi:hypothetical protein
MRLEVAGRERTVAGYRSARNVYRLGVNGGVRGG